MLDFIQIFLLLSVLFGPTVYLNKNVRIGSASKWIFAMLPMVLTTMGFWMAQLTLHMFQCQYEQQHLECTIRGEDWSAWIGYGSMLGVAAMYAGIPMAIVNVIIILQKTKKRP